MESTHPAWNTLMRRFGNIRGPHMTGQVMKQFHMERESPVLEVMDDMLEATSRTKRVDTKKRGSSRANLDRIESIVDESTTFELSEMEKKMNANESLRPNLTKEHFQSLAGVDTRISVCSKCGKRVLNFGLAVHEHEYHSGGIKGEVDDNELQRRN